MHLLAALVFVAWVWLRHDDFDSRLEELEAEAEERGA